MHRKGQIFSIDLMMSIFVFITCIAFVIIIIVQYQARFGSTMASQDIGAKALQASEILIKSEGETTDWEEDTSKLSSVGLAASDRRLSNAKLEQFINLSYDNVKELLKIKSLEFYFALKNPSGGIVKTDGGQKIELGIKPNLTAKNIVTIKRMALQGQNERFAEITLWK